MASIFGNAMSLLGRDGPSKGEGKFAGSVLGIHDKFFRVKKRIGSGGFAEVYSARDEHGTWYALKYEVSNDEESFDAFVREMRALRALSGHPNITTHIVSGKKPKEGGPEGAKEFLIVTELCSGGSVIDLLNKGPLTQEQIIKIIHGAASAVAHCHAYEKPVTHRDIKVENLLFDSNAKVKLCDFGSVTTEILQPDDDWTTAQRTKLEEEYQRNTTPMYRAPEILETYNNWVVGPKQDIWALGAVLFYLCYRKHPFEDSSKLAIVNAKYVYPKDPEYQKNDCFNPLIESCLIPDPNLRVTAKDLITNIEALAVTMNIDLTEQVSGVDQWELLGDDKPLTPIVVKPPVPPARPPPPAPKATEEITKHTSAVVNRLRGEGMSFFNKLKEKSTAAMQTFHSTLKGADVTFVTSRLLFAARPDGVIEALAQQAEDVLRNQISEIGRPFLMVNISQRKLRNANYEHHPIGPFIGVPSAGVPPTLNNVVGYCKHMHAFLRDHSGSAVVMYGNLEICCFLSTAFLLYVRVYQLPFQALDYVSSKVQTFPALRPSYHRLLDLLTKVVSSPSKTDILGVVYNYKTNLASLTIEPIPIFNANGTGCRPFIEIYVGGSRIWKTRAQYQDLKVFEATNESSIEIPFDDVLIGEDVSIAVYHAKWNTIHSKMLRLRMFTINFHQQFNPYNGTLLSFRKGEIDCNRSHEEKIPDNLRVVVGLKLSQKDRGFHRTDGTKDPDFLQYNIKDIQSNCMVDGYQEYEKMRLFVPGSSNSNLAHASNLTSTSISFKSAPTPPKPAPVRGDTSNFFGSLNWDATAAAQQPIEDSTHDWPETAPPKNIQQALATSTAEYDGIRIQHAPEEPDADQYKFDFEKKETPIMGQSSPISNTLCHEMDLLGLNFDAPAPVQTSQVSQLPDPFADLLGAGNLSSNVTTHSTPAHSGDLLCDWGAPAVSSTQGMHRNVSAPAFQQQKQAAPPDPFAEFLAASSLSNPASKNGSATNSGSNTPAPSRPNYSRSAFTDINPPPKKNTSASAFDDLLSSQGFTSSAKTASRTMADMRREEEVKTMDPVAIKIRDWTEGKESNIRALLGSLQQVLWEGAEEWVPPTIADLVSYQQVKLSYRRALLKFHPDKQRGLAHEELAQAIFGELNVAWKVFDEQQA